MKKFTLSLFFGLLCVFSTPIIAQNYNQNLTDHFNKLIDQDDLLQEDVQWIVTNENVSSTSDLHHIYFNQVINEIEIYGTNSSIHILNGETVVTNNQFILKSANKIIGSSSPSLSAIDAVIAAAK